MKKILATIKKIYTQQPNENFIKEDAWAPIILSDPVSIPLARLLSRIKRIHPNHITLLTVPFAFTAAYMFMKGELIYGALFYWLNFVLDGTDGKVARLTGKTSKFGEKLDYYTDTVNNLAMYFGLWWSQYYVYGEWFIGGVIVFAHYAIMVFGYVFVGDFRYKTIFPRVFSYYSPFEEAFGTFLFAPLFNIVHVLFPLLVMLQLLSYTILFIKHERKIGLTEIKERILRMLKIQ